MGNLPRILLLALLALTMATLACGQSEEDKQATAEERRQGFHCLSAWDGNHDGLETLVKQHLNDPSSMETHQTLISPVVDGTHRIKMEFGAANAFGGMVRHVAIGYIDHETCEATLDYID